MIREWGENITVINFIHGSGRLCVRLPVADVVAALTADSAEPEALSYGGTE